MLVYRGQGLPTVWKNLENIMTIDEEMKDLSAKAAKASRKEEHCKNEAQFSNVFLQSSLAAMEGQNLKNGTKMPPIMHTNEPNKQYLGSKLVCAYL